MAGHPARNRSVRCAANQSGRATYEISRRSSPTAITSATSITAQFPSLHSNIMRWRHDNSPRRFKISPANGSQTQATKLRIVGPFAAPVVEDNQTSCSLGIKLLLVRSPHQGIEQISTRISGWGLVLVFGTSRAQFPLDIAPDRRPLWKGSAGWVRLAFGTGSW